MPNPIFDFHAHFSFKPANSKNYKSGKMPDPDHYFERYRTKGELGISLTNLIKGVLKTSQVHGEAAHEGQLRIICNSLYPIEKEFTQFFVTKDIANLTGHSLSRIKQIKGDKISYFNHLQLIYKNLLENHNKKFHPTAKSKYVLVKNYTAIEAERNKNKNNICIINSMEGAHSFASDIKIDGDIINLHTEEKKFLKLKANRSDSPFGQHLNAMVKNINTVKTKWEYPPFFVTFAHHYYNHLAGHAPSLGFFINVIVKQSGNTKTKTGANISFFKLGFRPWGHMILDQMLKRTDNKGNKVRRILIDTKHLSVQARIDYHKIQKVEADVKDMALPIIQSHTAVSGRKSMQASVDAGMDFLHGEKSRSKYFNPSELNLFDDEIVDIVNSDGLIGIMLDEKRIVGKSIPPESGFKNKRQFKKHGNKSKKSIAKVVELKHRILWLKDEPSATKKQIDKLKVRLEKEKRELLKHQKEVKPAYLSILCRQLFHIVHNAGEKAWNHVCLGSDYEGVINPMDIYPQSKDLKNIEKDLVDFWNDQLNSSDKKTKALYTEICFGKTPKSIVRKFLWTNSTSFLKKYFTDEYLLEGINPK